MVATEDLYITSTLIIYSHIVQSMGTPPPLRAAGPTALCRLVKISGEASLQGSLVLMPAAQSVEDATPSPLNIGRDRAYGPLLRLKDMQVSKMHASIYFDPQQAAYCIVDLGSTHGTYVEGDRLSPAKKPSRPRLLEHLKLLPFSLMNTLASAPGWCFLLNEQTLRYVALLGQSIARGHYNTSSAHS